MTVDPPGERLHALDAVRAGALLLGVAFHATLSFLPGAQIWLVRDTQSEFLGDFFVVAHMFRMTAFFLIAGFFGRMLLHRRGTGGFIRNRLVRITLPLLAFWPIVFTAIISAFLWGAMTMNGGAMPEGPPPPPLTAATFPLTHLWFLYVLTIFYAAALILRAPIALMDRGGRFRAKVIDPAMRLLTATPAAAVLLAVPLALALLSLPVWYAAAGIPTPDTGYMPNTAALVGFGTAFAFGWLLERQRSLLDAIRRWWAVYLVAAMALTAACLWQVAGNTDFAPMTAGPKMTGYAACYALAAWTWTLGITGAALRFLSGHSPAIRYVADSSYWVYLVHLPVVMVLQVLVFPVALPAVLKWALVTAGAFAILFASYHLLVRHSWIGKWLNGRKLPWRKPAPAMEASPA